MKETVSYIKYNELNENLPLSKDRHPTLGGNVYLCRGQYRSLK